MTLIKSIQPKIHLKISLLFKVRLKNGWNSKQMITEGDATSPLGTTLHAFRNQEKTKQRSTIVKVEF